MKNIKQSDTKQKFIAKLYLESIGFFDVNIQKDPCDIRGISPRDNNGQAFESEQNYLFDVKGGNYKKNGTRSGIDENYWGVITHTELKAALKHGKNFKWIFVFRKDNNPNNEKELIGWEIVVRETSDIIQYFYLPPLVFHFNMPSLNPKKKRIIKRKNPVKSIINITENKLRYLLACYDNMKVECDKNFER
jgi:hypothetical protein